MAEVHDAGISDDDFLAVLSFVADVSAGFAYQAGVGAMETAGSLVSYLVENPRDIRPFINGGVMELPANWIERGYLTWQGVDGKVHRPRDVRLKRIVRKMRPTPTQESSE